MDYTRTSLRFKLRKAARYVGLYGINRTLVKVRGQYHMKRQYPRLPANHVRHGANAHVGLIGCGNYAYSVIAYYLRKNYGQVIRACMDSDINRAASLFESYRADYFTADAAELLGDPRIDLIYVASNHASHAEYAITALRAGKAVHIEKPHAVSVEQLERLCEAQAKGPGRIVSIGYNRPHSRFGQQCREFLGREEGELMQNWFVAGHKIAPDHWYFKPEEGGRVLGNLCHWTDFVYQMMPPERRFPIRIYPTRALRADSDIAVSYSFGDGSIAVITFSEKGDPFEGVRERYAAHRGNTLIALDDFKSLVIDVAEQKHTWKPRVRDHGHESSVTTSYTRAAARDAPGLDAAYVWEAGQLFLRTREALESSRQLVLEAFERNDHELSLRN